MTPARYRHACSTSTSHLSRWLIRVTLLMPILLGLSPYTYAESIRNGETLPPIEITAGGKIILDDSDYQTAPWAGPVSIPMVQVYQYVPGTRKGGSLYDALTERMQRELDPTRFRITAIVNLDASSVFIKPFVRAEVVAKQRVFQLATMVLDEEGVGVEAWQLDQESTFIVTDEQNTVLAAIFGPPSPEDLDRIFAALADRLLP